MSWDRFINKKDETKQAPEVKQEQVVEKQENNLVETLVPFRVGSTYYISKVKFNPDNFETFEMHQEVVAATFLNGQVGLNHFFTQYQNAKKKGK
jgi:hypothetical protein